MFFIASSYIGGIQKLILKITGCTIAPTEISTDKNFVNAFNINTEHTSEFISIILSMLSLSYEIFLKQSLLTIS